MESRAENAITEGAAVRYAGPYSRRETGMTRSGFLLGSAAVLLSASLSAAQDVRAAVEAGNQKFAEAVSRGDAAAVGALYTTEAQLLPAGSDFVTGTSAIAAFWKSAFDSGIQGAALTTLEVESHGDLAHEVGRYELRGADGKAIDHGKYVVIWKKEGPTWKLHRDIWTTSVPPAAR
jgi:ketosteroid isomerase-like protein